ncbi:hypothetical protein CDL12_02811 [Handroanthus impetiginosus]|uniref:S-protein homolog n=1 Tax=Handroanthus impetiginosus TaxID=429701 RepID=A0A2G9I4C3_9LAMI|nr:hypothetical protein CDL12_02811 [Handroanthus impetiginosus]
MRYTIVYIPLFLLFTWTNHIRVIAQEKRTCFATYRYEIHVINNLPPKSAPLVIHCASGDDDLGNHTLTYKQDYHWDFCENFVFSTLFFCHFRWGTKEKALEVFNAHWRKRCDDGYCYWEARNDGLYVSTGLNEDIYFKKYVDWQNRKG